MIQFLVFCVLIHISNGFHWSSPLKYQAVVRSRPSMLHALPSIGEQFDAKVEDVVGPVRHSVAIFSIDKDGQTLQAKMPTKSLSLAERMSLKIGSVLNVRVTKNDDKGNLEVLLSDHVPPAPLKPIRPPTKRKWLVGKLNRPEPTREEYFMINGMDETTVPNGGLLLTNLKTGTRLEGEVIQSTEYGAFIDCNIYRLAKGRVLQRTHGILHKSEIAPSVLRKYGKLYDDPHDRYKSRAGRMILDVGTRITVYVKHVFKNQGRISFTTDPTINKAKLVQEVMEKREAGSVRRQGRRLRRELAEVEVGDLVHGVVQKVVPQGVLVTVTSVGNINATGLISENFLPKQFQLPSNINPEYRQELLGKEFMPGRPIICSVHKVNVQSNADMMYSMKLMLEEMGPVVKLQRNRGLDDEDEEDTVKEDDEKVFERRYQQLQKMRLRNLAHSQKMAALAKLDKSADDAEAGEGDTDSDAEKEEEEGDSSSSAAGESDESDYDLGEEENTLNEADFRRIYKELKKDKETAVVGDIYEWEEVKDVVEEKLLTMQDFKDSLFSVGVAVYEEGLAAPVKLKQFLDFAGVIQWKLYNKEETLKKMEDPVYLDKREKAKEKLRLMSKQRLNRFRKFGVEKIVEEHADDMVEHMEYVKNGPPPNPFWVDDALPAEGDDEYTLALKQQYRELRGNDKALHYKKFWNWSDIQDLLKRKAIKPHHLQVCMFGAQRRFDLYGFNFSEFEELVALVDQAALSDDPDWDRIERENNLLDDPNFVPMPPLPPPEEASAATTPATGDATDGGASSSSDSTTFNLEKESSSGFMSRLQSMIQREEQDMMEEETPPVFTDKMSNLELYVHLTAGEPLLDLPSFRTWMPIQRLIESERLTSQGLDNLIDAVMGEGAAKNNRITKVDPVQFDRIVNILKNRFPDLLKDPTNTDEQSSDNNNAVDEEEGGEEGGMGMYAGSDEDEDGYTDQMSDEYGDDDDYDEEDEEEEEEVKEDRASSTDEAAIEDADRDHGHSSEEKAEQADVHDDATYSDSDVTDVKIQETEKVNEAEEADEEEEEPQEGEDSDDDGVMDDEAVLSEVYDFVRGDEQRLLVSQFKQWDEISKLKLYANLTYQALDKLINEIVAPTAAHTVGATITRDQFKTLVQTLDDKYGTHSQSVQQSSIEAQATSEQEDMMKVYAELYDRIKGNEVALTVARIKQSKEIQSLLASSVDELSRELKKTITAEDMISQFLIDILGKAAAKKSDSTLTLEQFSELMTLCSEKTIEATPENQEAVFRDSYEQLRSNSIAAGGDGRVVVSHVMEGDFVQMALTMKMTTPEGIDMLLAVALQVSPQYLRANRDKIPVSYEQYRMMTMLSDNPLEVEKQLRMMQNKGLLTDENYGEKDDSDDDESEEEEEEEERSENNPSVDAMLGQLYQDMKEQFGGEASVKTFLKCEFIAHALRNGQLSRNQVTEAVNEIMGAGAAASKSSVKMSEEQYIKIMKRLNEMSAENLGVEGSEESE